MTWRDHANCTTLDPDLFFMPDTDGMSRAEASAVRGAYQRTCRFLRGVCSDCAVWQECRLASLTELGGLWGGVTGRKRDEVRWTYTGRDSDGTSVEALAEQVMQALADIDTGVRFEDALDRAGIADHPFFHDFEAYLPPGRTTRRLEQDDSLFPLELEEAAS